MPVDWDEWWALARARYVLAIGGAGQLAGQSCKNPDGAGIGTFELDGTPEVDKNPIAAYKDRSFVREAKTEESRTFVVHGRFASTGASN